MRNFNAVTEWHGGKHSPFALMDEEAEIGTGAAGTLLKPPLESQQVAGQVRLERSRRTAPTFASAGVPIGQKQIIPRA